MSPVKRAACMLAAGAALGVCAAPSIAKADPVVDAAVAQLNDLGIGTLTGMPSGRTTYRTTDEFNAELTALATTYPTQVVVKDAPYKSIQGRTIKYVEITNNASAVGDGKPVFFNMGAIHGNETRGRRGQPRVRVRRAAAGQDQPEGRRAAGQGAVDRPAAHQPRRPRLQERRGQRCPAPRELRSVRRDRPARHVHDHGRRPQPQLSVRLGLEHRRLPGRCAAPARAPSPRSRTRWTSCSRTRS